MVLLSFQRHMNSKMKLQKFFVLKIQKLDMLKIQTMLIKSYFLTPGGRTLDVIIPCFIFVIEGTLNSWLESYLILTIQKSLRNPGWVLPCEPLLTLAANSIHRYKFQKHFVNLVCDFFLIKDNIVWVGQWHPGQV